MKGRKLFDRFSIIAQLMLLVVTLSALAAYNYTTQRQVFLEQLRVDTGNIVAAVRSSIVKFHATQSTMELQELVENISLNLAIFEFRYLAPDGTIINSMFKDEVGQKFDHPGFKTGAPGQQSGENIYLDVRDLTNVMAVSHPVYFEGEMVGIIDLALDISEYDGAPEAVRESSLRQMRAGIRNLISVIESSITNSLKIISTVDIFDFLSNYMSSSQNVLQIAILSADGKIEVSNDKKRVGSVIDTRTSGQIVRIDGQPAYPVIAPLGASAGSDRHLYLLIDARPYVANERKLLFTAIGTSSLAIIFSLLITYSMYRFNIERTLQENMRLEHTVKERTTEIEHLSRTDPLTGLNNRRHLDEILDYEFRRAQRYDHGLALIVLDLDHFKKINDTYGHLGGDAVLRGLGVLLRDHLRETDIAGRYGGEEFVIALPETGLEAAKKVAEHLRALIEKMAVDFEGLLIPVTCSIGVGVLRPDHVELKALLHEADAALYRSKQAGRNRVTDFSAIAEAG